MTAFRGFTAFDEGAGESFHGRADETARLVRLLQGDARAVVLSGPSGIGKTSLVRAGLVPALSRLGVQVVAVGAYEDLDGEIVRAASRLGVTPPIPNQSSADYLARIARDSPHGLVLVFDHLEEALADEVARGADLGALLGRVVEQAGTRVRLLLSVEDTAFARLDQLRDAGASSALAASAWMTLGGLGQTEVAEILERTAIQSGTFFEAGLATAVAADLCRAGRCRPLDLQLVARAIVDLRLTSVRKYQRSGGAAVLPALFFERMCLEAGGRPARKALLATAERREVTADDLEPSSLKAREAVSDALAALKGRGVLRGRTRGRREAYALAHAGLRGAVESFGIEDRARATAARRALRRRLTAGERLRLRELWAVHRHLAGALAPDEQVTFMRSVRRNALQIGGGAALVIALLVALYANMRRSYTLGLEPRDAGGAARVVVRLGREGSPLAVLPNHPRFGAVLADTGFSASGLSADTAARIAAGKATGTLDAGDARVPTWLRDVLAGLRPVPRGVAKALMGDPDGVTSLEQAFSDPLARRETLEALAVIGRGRAGEDEILAAALSDSAPEIRRRGVEVAAAIDRRQATSAPAKAGAEPGAHGRTLRSALSDKSLDVRTAVLRETTTLPVAEAASILTVALRDPDPAFRHAAEEATGALAARAPGAAAGALEQVLQSPDGGVRRAGLALLETIAAKDPASCAAALQRVVANEAAPEEARVAALLILRRAGTPSAELRPLLEKAVRPEASPRLRAAALPLYARLVTPEQAEEIARTEMKGSTAARAAGAAVWGTVAMSRPDLATKPLHGLLYDPAPETRLEATRSFAYLKRDGLDLCDKALKDGNVEIQKAAIESALALAPVNPYQVAEMLGKAIKYVRVSARRNVIDALARLGATKPAAAMPPLARALKDTDVGTRAAAANAFCSLAAKNAAAASPYLRIAARDDREEVRTAAAACLGDLADADPKGAARMAAELGDAAEANVRVAAAEALGKLGAKARDLAVPALLKLVGDADNDVRVAAERSVGAIAQARGNVDGGGPVFEGKRASDAEHALDTALTQGDAAERRIVVAAAAKAGLVGVLRQAGADGDDSVRLEAVRAAGVIGGPALEVVRGALDDRANAVRAEATRILAAVSGTGAREVLPIFESMLRGGDKAAREAAVIGVGELQGAGEPGARLLGEALGQHSEALRTAAARALGRLAEREPAEAEPYLERAVRDPSYDVRSAAIPGLALAWSRRQRADELARALVGAEADSTRRFVALEALVLVAKDATKDDAKAARAALDHAGESGPPLARLAAQIGRAFVDARPQDMHAFIERLLGG
ncbi:MAG TPA: HEAT repeat domain-containing protein [Polyangia bacterium]|nr:HEAT repeat domain-containing protein [Polyangia bacterium]